MSIMRPAVYLRPEQWCPLILKQDIQNYAHKRTFIRKIHHTFCYSDDGLADVMLAVERVSVPQEPLPWSGDSDTWSLFFSPHEMGGGDEAAARQVASREMELMLPGFAVHHL